MSRAIDPNIPYLIDGQPMVGGYAYYGVANQDPKLNPITIYSDANFTVPIINPQRTGAQGKIENAVYTEELEYSFLVTDVDDNQVEFEPALEPLNSEGLVQADQDLNGFKFTTVGDATANDQFATLGQSNKNYPMIAVIDGLLSTPDAIIATTPIPLDALLDNQQIIVQMPNTLASNTIGNPTFKLDGFSPFEMYRDSNDNLKSGDTMGPFAFLHLGFSAPLNKWQLLDAPSQGLISNDIDMDGFKHFNVADSVNRDEYLTYGQGVDKFASSGLAAGGVNALTATLTNFDSLKAGFKCVLKNTVGPNGIASPTLNINGSGNKTITRDNLQPLVSFDTGEINNVMYLAYDSVADVFSLLNPKINKNGNFLNNTISGLRISDNSLTSAQLGEHSVGRSEIADGAVHTEQLDTDTATDNFFISSIAGNEDRRIIGANGGYGFYPRVRLFNHTGTFGTNWYIFSSQGGNFALNNYITLVGNPGGFGTENVEGESQCRFINASAPWNMGHGDIALFITLRVSEAGDVTGGSVSVCPAWGYNGKTDVNADRVSKTYSEDGSEIFIKKYKSIEDPEAAIILPPWRGGDSAQWNNDTAAAYSERPMIEVEIDQEMKMRDMDDIPHGFIDKLETDTIVLIDPTSDIVDSLRCIHDCNETSITALFKDGHLVIGDLVSGYTTPLGVEVRSVSWA